MNIPGVVHRRAVLSHEDERRQLFTIFNGDLNDFTAVQLKWFTFKSYSLVGGHYHNDFDEVFCIVKGGGDYELVHADNPEQREVFYMTEGDMVLVPKRVAHRAMIKKDSIIIAANSQPYVSPEVSDFKFDFGQNSFPEVSN
jgi:mannose-6-phosphate isomerase-like protein (cupin superfamily)